MHSMHSIMANFNLGRNVANTRERKYTITYKVAKCHSLWLDLRMRYGSLIKFKPSGYYTDLQLTYLFLQKLQQQHCAVPIH